MSTELEVRKPEVIANEIVRLSNRMLEDAIEVGRRFVELKASVPHGEWGKWLEYTGYKRSSADNMMRLFRAYGAEELSLFGNVKSQTFGNLGYSKALALLAVPEEDREQFAEEVHAKELSVRELKAKIKEAQNQAEGWKLKAEQAKVDADLQREAAAEQEKQNSLLSHRVKELENRPVEVATVDATEEQLREAENRGQAAAMKDAAQEMEKAKKQWKEQTDGLEQQNRELADALEAARRETDQYQGTNADLISQLEELKKNRVQAGEPLLKMKLYFEQLQETANAMVALLPQVDEVNRAKLKRALPGALRQLAERIGGQ